MKKGATLIEIIVIMSIFITLAGLVTINLVGAKHKASLSSSLTLLVADLRSQQLKAMVGDTEGRGLEGSYGIYFTTSQYILFHDLYNPSNSTNFAINLGDNIQVVSPNFAVSFATGSGELTTNTSIIINNIQTGEQKTIQLNKLGVLTTVN